MIEQLFPALFFGLVSTLGLVAVILWQLHHRQERQKSWGDVAQELGFALETSLLSGTRLEGTLGTARLLIEHYEGRHTRTEFLLSAPRPYRISVGASGTFATALYGEVDFEVGDVLFDPHAQLAGDPVAASALLTAEVRRHLLFLLNRGAVYGTTIEHRVSGGVSSPQEAAVIAKQLRWVHEQLSAPRDAYPDRLVQSIRLDPIPNVRKRCLEVLASPELRAAPALVRDTALEALRDESHDVAVAAARVLPSASDEVVSALLERLRHGPSEPGAENVLRVLLGVARSPSLEAVIQVALNSRVLELRQQAITFVGEQRLTQFIPALSELLADAEEPLAASLAGAFGSLGEASATPALLELLAHDKNSVRRAAAVALGKVGSLDAVEALHPIAHAVFVDPWLKGAARDAINAIQSRQGSAEAGRLTLAEDRSAEGGLSLAEDHQTEGETPPAADPRRSQG
jgi:hypothetical protein